MSPWAQRIAIAEACGWNRSEEYDEGFGGKGTLRLTTGWKNREGIWFRALPDYLNDLNAMHEAEKVFASEQFQDFLDNLANVLHEGSDWTRWRPCIANLFRASAAQRAEAFLRTIGKWQPTTPAQGGTKA